MRARARRKGGGAPVRVGDLLPDLAQKGGWGQVVDLCRLQAAWGDLMGTVVATHSRPDTIGRGRLTVTVDNSAWLMQLSFYRDEMRAKVGGFFGDGRVEDVFLRVGRVAPAARPSKGGRKPRPVPPEVVREVEQGVAVVPDPEVRSALRKLLLAELARGRPAAGG